MMKPFLSLLNLSSVFVLAACGFQSAQNKNSVDFNSNGKGDSEQVQELGKKASGIRNPLSQESSSQGRETPERYKQAID